MSSGRAQLLAASSGSDGAHPDDLAFIRDRRVGRLATADAHGKPSVVPVVYASFALDDEPAIAIAIDEKPKGDPRALRRVRNILERPEIALVVDEYREDWDALAWVLVRGSASLIEPGDQGHVEALAALGHGRRSVRAFERRPVPRAIVEEAIAAAGWAPSPHGRQPWRFVVVESQERRDALADAMAETWRTQLQLDGQDETIVEARLHKSRDRLQRAPVLIIPCLYLQGLDTYPDADRQQAEVTMAIQSLGAAVQNLLLSLYAAGVDGGWMCAPLFCPEVVQATLGLDATLDPHALIAVGYAASDPVRRPRLPLDELIVDWQWELRVAVTT